MLLAYHTGCISLTIIQNNIRILSPYHNSSILSKEHDGDTWVGEGYGIAFRDEISLG